MNVKYLGPINPAFIPETRDLKAADEHIESLRKAGVTAPNDLKVWPFKLGEAQ